jgi:hypothetical protein
MVEQSGLIRDAPEEQVVSVWNAVTIPHGARGTPYRPGTFADGRYYVADVRTQEPRSHGATPAYAYLLLNLMAATITYTLTI